MNNQQDQPGRMRRLLGTIGCSLTVEADSLVESRSKGIIVALREFLHPSPVSLALQRAFGHEGKDERGMLIASP